MSMTTHLSSQPIGFSISFSLSRYVYLCGQLYFFEVYNCLQLSFSLIYRLGRVISAVVSEEKAVGSSSSGTDMFKLTYLEVGFENSDLGKYMFFCL